MRIDTTRFLLLPTRFLLLPPRCVPSPTAGVVHTQPHTQTTTTDDDETALPEDIAACEEYDSEDEANAAAAARDGDGDVDMFGDNEQQQQQQAQKQKQWGGRKVPKGISAAVAAAMESDGGFAVTKFNMNAEREEGNIDEEVRGYIRRVLFWFGGV